MASASPLWTKGAHSIALEPPDLLAVHLGEWIEDGEAWEIMETINAAGARHGPLFMLALIPSGYRSNPKARSILARVGFSVAPRAIAVVSTLRMGFIVGMVYRAGRILAPARFTTPMQIFGSEREGRAFLDAERARSERRA